MRHNTSRRNINKRKKRKAILRKIELTVLCFYLIAALFSIGIMICTNDKNVFGFDNNDTISDNISIPNIESIDIIEAEEVYTTTETTQPDELELVKFHPIEYRYEMTDEEFSMFVRCVEAEVTGTEHTFGLPYDDVYLAKLHVAQVILNRIESPNFPNTVEEVIFYPYAFSPVYDGRYYDVEIEDITIQACKDALLASTEDTVYGCEFFIQDRTYCKYGYYVFTDAVGHSFFKEY